MADEEDVVHRLTVKVLCHLDSLTCPILSPVPCPLSPESLAYSSSPLLAESIGRAVDRDRWLFVPRFQPQSHRGTTTERRYWLQ